MHYFSIKFSKIAERWGCAGGSSPPTLLNLRLRWSEVAWFDEIGVFQTDYDKIEFKKTVMTSFQWCHHYYITKKVTKLTSRDFSIMGPSQSHFWLRQMVYHVPVHHLESDPFSQLHALIETIYSRSLGCNRRTDPTLPTVNYIIFAAMPANGLLSSVFYPHSSTGGRGSAVIIIRKIFP